MEQIILEGSVLNGDRVGSVGALDVSIVEYMLGTSLHIPKVFFLNTLNGVLLRTR
jgi:hypothetical protein